MYVYLYALDIWILDLMFLTVIDLVIFKSFFLQK